MSIEDYILLYLLLSNENIAFGRSKVSFYKLRPLVCPKFLKFFGLFLPNQDKMSYFAPQLY